MIRPILKQIALALIFLVPFTQSAQAGGILCFPHLQWPDEGTSDRPISSDPKPKKLSDEAVE
jgi:hypothetical protein